MANFMKLTARTEQRIGEYATRLLRIEAHLRRGEKRAAKARLEGFREEIEEFTQDLEFPAEMTIVGAQLGFFSGKGSFLTGRLPGALLGAAAGWMYGQSQTVGHQRYLEEISQRVALIEQALAAEGQRTAGETPEEQPSETAPSTPAESASRN